MILVNKQRSFILSSQKFSETSYEVDENKCLKNKCKCENGHIIKKGEKKFRIYINGKLKYKCLCKSCKNEIIKNLI